MSPKLTCRPQISSRSTPEEHDFAKLFSQKWALVLFLEYVMKILFTMSVSLKTKTKTSRTTKQCVSLAQN